MRISDWSSDVCSSDLPGIPANRWRMIGILRIFYGASGTRPWLVLACLLLAGVAEGVGLATLLPLLTLAINDGAGDSSSAAYYVQEVLAFFDLTPTLSRSEEHTSELQSLMRISYAVSCLK